MGRPKALLPFAGKTLIEHIESILVGLFDEIIVVASPYQELPPMSATLIRDELSYQGPAAGIYYGLKAVSKESAFVTSCDVPFVNLSFVSYLISMPPNYDAVVPYWEGRFQTLHAVYRRSLLPLFLELLKGGDPRLISLYKKIRMREVHKDEIHSFDPDGLCFFNMNTPQEYDSALKLCQDRIGSNRNRGIQDNSNIKSSSNR